MACPMSMTCFSLNFGVWDGVHKAASLATLTENMVIVPFALTVYCIPRSSIFFLEYQSANICYVFMLFSFLAYYRFLSGCHVE